MNWDCEASPAQVSTALFAAMSHPGGHWCMSWQRTERAGGVPVIACGCRTEIELGAAS